MTFRHAILAATAVLLLGAGVFLWFEVRASPAAGDVHAIASEHEPVRDASEGRELVRRPSASAGTRPSAVPAGLGIERPRLATGASGPSRADPSESKDPFGETPGQYDAAMSEANKAYDRGEFDEAKALAQKLLAKRPGNVRMLRILVSSSCIDGDHDTAQKNYLLLPPADREQMKLRCGRYGVTFPDKPDGRYDPPGSAN